MSALELFQSAEWSVRVIDIDGEPWFDRAAVRPVPNVRTLDLTEEVTP